MAGFMIRAFAHHHNEYITKSRVATVARKVPQFACAFPEAAIMKSREIPVRI